MEIFHPDVAARDCDDCRRWQYDDSQNGSRQVIVRRGKRLRRRGLPPCDTSQGCPKGRYDHPIQLTTKNRQAYWHYQQCKAVGDFPKDEIVRQNAAIIRRVEDTLKRQQTEIYQHLLTASLTRPL